MSESQLRRTGVRIFSERRYRTDGIEVTPVDDDGGRIRFDQYVETLGSVTVVVRVDGATGRSPLTLAPGVTVLGLPTYVGVRAFVSKSAAVVRAVASATRTDELLVFRLPGMLGFIAAAHCRLLGRRYVVEVRGDPGEVLRTGTLGRAGQLAAPLAAAVQRWVVRGAAGCWYVTERTLQDAYPARPGVPVVGVSDVELDPSDFVSWDGPSARSETIDLDLETGDAAAAGRRRPLLVAVGTQEQLYKGHDVLLDAVGRLRAEGREVDLQLVGAGRMQDQLRARADTIGLHDVDFTGQVSDRDELRRILDAATVFVMPSRTEGLPRALAEAMARGRPAVGSRVGGITELLDDEVLVPPGDADSLAGTLARVLDDTELAERLGRQNFERAQRMRRQETEPRQIAWLRSVAPSASRRVGHVLGSLDVGGCERLLQDIATRDSRRRLDQRETATMVVITLAGRKGVLAPNFAAAGVEVVECPLRPWPTFVPRLYRCLRRLDLDVLVSHVSLFSGLVTSVARLAGISRRVAWFHTDGDYLPGSPQRSLWQSYLRRLLRTNPTTVVGVTWAALEFAAGSKSATALPDPLVVSNGVDTERFAPGDRARARQAFGLPAARPVVLHIGRAAPEKRRTFLLEVLQELPEDATMVFVSAVGDADLAGMAPEVRSDPRLRLLGPLDDVVPVLQAADVFALPSNREGLPVAVLEALSVGLPVVAADISGIRALDEELTGIRMLRSAAGPAAWAAALLAEAARPAEDRRAIRASMCQSPYSWDSAADEWTAVWSR